MEKGKARNVGEAGEEGAGDDAGGGVGLSLAPEAHVQSVRILDRAAGQRETGKRLEGP